jgi:hypothetical protein
MLTLERLAQAASILTCATAIAAPIPLYSNGSTNPADHGLATGVTSASGAPAPPAASWSELQGIADGSNALAGLSIHPSGTPGAFRLADDFVVSGFAYGWQLSALTLFAYASGGPVEFDNLHVRIWSGNPATLGSQIVWDSAATGALLTASPLPLYRIFNSITLPETLPDSTRQLWSLRLTTPNLALAPGWYWIDWQVAMSDPESSAFSPTTTILGSRGPVGANAIQLKSVSGTAQWSNIIDPGKPAPAPDFAQELPFMIEGTAAAPPCEGDADGSGIVNFADISAVLTNWGSNYLPASGQGDADGTGIVDFADITAVLQGWGLVCE